MSTAGTIQYQLGTAPITGCSLSYSSVELGAAFFDAVSGRNSEEFF